MLGQELPEHLANPPKLTMASAYYLEVYNLLGTCRAIGFGGVGPIPYTAISQYCHDHSITGDDLTEVVLIISKLDAETLGDK